MLESYSTEKFRLHGKRQQLLQQSRAKYLSYQNSTIFSAYHPSYMRVRISHKKPFIPFSAMIWRVRAI